jgi:hypothetical protein
LSPKNMAGSVPRARYGPKGMASLRPLRPVRTRVIPVTAPSRQLRNTASSPLGQPRKKPADFNRYKGRKAIIKTYQPINGKKEFSGRLEGVQADSVVLDTDESGQLLIPMAQVALAQLDVEF